MAQLTKRAYDIIKSIDPKATVCSHWWRCFNVGLRGYVSAQQQRFQSSARAIF
jgi:hypothetical protein